MIGRLRLRLTTSSNVFRVRNRVRPPNPFAGELTTQDDIYLFTQDGRGIEMNQDVVDAFQSLTTQDGLELLTQDGRTLETNQNLVDDFPGLLSQDGLEFITQDGRHLLTNVRD